MKQIQKTSCARARRTMAEKRKSKKGEGYVDSGVKILIAVVIGAILFLTETWHIPAEILRHYREIIIGEYPIPKPGDKLIYSFVSWGMAMIVLFCLPGNHSGGDESEG